MCSALKLLECCQFIQTDLGRSSNLGERFDAGAFVRNKIQEVRSTVGRQMVLLACSGGLSSNVVAAIIQRATNGANVIPVFVDTGFLRKNEADTVSETIKRAPLKLPLKVIDARKRVMKSVEQAETAIEKRKTFYETFYTILRELGEGEEAKLVAFGTSAKNSTAIDQPSITSLKELLTRHSLQVIEPLGALSRQQVLKVAENLELPPRLSDLNPFPAPGLLIRVVGRVNDERLKEAREANAIAEDEFQYIKPTQCLAAIIENKDDDDVNIDKIRERISDFLDVGSNQVDLKIPRSKVAGLREEKRVYMKVSASRVTLLGSKEIFEPDHDDLVGFPVEFVEKQKEFTRCLYNVTKKPKNGKYLAVVRAILTDDFSRANVAKLDWGKLYTISERIMDKCGKVGSVYYDVTPKPPATVELE